MNNSKRLNEVIQYAESYAVSDRLEFLTPELVLLGLCCCSGDFSRLCASYQESALRHIKNDICNLLQEHVPDYVEEYELLPSVQMSHMMEMAEINAVCSSREEIDIPHVLHVMLGLEDSYAAYLLHHYLTEDETELLRCIIDAYEGRSLPDHTMMDFSPDDYCFSEQTDAPMPGMSPKQKWTELVVCINDELDKHNPLIGRSQELERTIQVLCRRDKNNPLHVGEPGVGKTALIYGLAERIAKGQVPARLKDARIYQMDMGSMVAGTQFRGEFEDRIKRIMKGVAQQKNAIVYIDEIHTLIGSGSVSSESSLDGSNILKPYLESGDIRFIGATTYKEYDRYFQKSQGLVRRFQKIDVAEPSQEEAVRILEGLKAHYEEYHSVVYDQDVMRYAVELSSKYMTDRFLPDKAIDLIDEAGAFRELHPLRKKVQVVDKSLLEETVKKICRLSDDMFASTHSEADQLGSLQDDLSKKIYGQDEAVRQVVESVLMAKSGLNEADKPLASLLFVGPTGVGKTELCRVLARQLGVELVRFDMSEYTEKHAVAKLIGSPAGYVGYEDGGLLTDAVRRNPNCVLLMDEIEKAHPDIYNILLQVMDYARLTDNKGNKADFRNVILIMTSNAGAQYASQGAVGFGNTTSRGESMLQTVKKTFKPEFLNRLSGTVVFNDMDRHMASLILDKKLGELKQRLSAKKVTLVLSDEAREWLLSKGFNAQYGAREMDRVIRNTLNPILIQEILFGSLKEGGKARVKLSDGKLVLK